MVRKMSQQLGFSLVDQTKMVTAASELARNALIYGGGGTMRWELLSDGSRMGLRLVFADQGPGIPNLELAMSDGWTSGTGLGMGLSGAQAAGERFRHRDASRCGHARQYCALEMSVELHGAMSQRRYLIDEETKIGEARRDATHLAQLHGLDEAAAGRAAIVGDRTRQQSIAARRRRRIVAATVVCEDGSLIELLAIDRGRGMDNVERCLRDGYSTAGTPGSGLGSVRRLAAEFDIYSVAGEGTVVLARIGADRRACARAAVRFGAISVPVAGEASAETAGESRQRRA